MAKICLVSYEIHPTTPGGCGVLLFHSAHVLLSQGHEVIFLLDIPKEQFNRFRDQDRLSLPNHENCRAYLVGELNQSLLESDIKQSDFRGAFQWHAYRFNESVHEIYEREKPDIIEFFEYCGIAYYALALKALGLDYQESHLTVRLHNTLELIDREQVSNKHDLNRYMMYGLEHQTLRLAETVLYPSKRYLEKAFLPFYEEWFSNKVESKPAMVKHPIAKEPSSDPDTILFYGRLFGFKGVDIFVDAAVLYLSNPLNPPRKFLLVGYDSNMPPTGAGSYQDFLWRKIPEHLKKQFTFAGPLSWNQLEAYLPDVCFAVFPTYFESFCYAAHEIYAAGVPIIVADIPAFEDYFKHEVNALVFDGSVGNLTEQMIRLSTDGELLKRIIYPYPLTDAPLGSFYSLPKHTSWIHQKETVEMPDLLICVIADDPENLEVTINSLASIRPAHSSVIIATPVGSQETRLAQAWFLGGMYVFKDENGHPLIPTDIRTKRALVILKSGDIPSKEFFETALGTLSRQPQIAYVNCWKYIRENEQKLRLETFPLDTAAELVPFLHFSPYSRSILQTEPDQLLIDLFDQRDAQWGELSYLWNLENKGCSGLTIPKPYISQAAELPLKTPEMLLDYLIIRDSNPWRKSRLARFLLMTIFQPNATPLTESLNSIDSVKWFSWIKLKGKIRHSRYFFMIKPLASIIKKVRNIPKSV